MSPCTSRAKSRRHRCRRRSTTSDRTARARVLPSVGGIALNVRVGDNAFTPIGDHVEPAVSVRSKDDRANVGFCVLACVGNRATVLSGEAKGTEGFVTGKHGGIEHVMIDFDESVMAKMTIGDKIGIRAVGVGLELTDPGRHHAVQLRS